jgi:hypothetical protein
MSDKLKMTFGILKMVLIGKGLKISHGNRAGITQQRFLMESYF